MKKIALLILLLLAFDFGHGQTKIAELTFETAGGYTTDEPEFTDNGQDYFLRTDGSNIQFEVFANMQGSYYFAAQDINGEGAALPVSLLMDDINIGGYTNLEFRVHLAEDDSGNGEEDYDKPDYVRINYDIDNTGSFSPLLWIENDDATYNTAPLIDTDFDEIGDGTEITNTFTQFTRNITGSGFLLDIEIVFNLTAADEDIAIDNIEIWGVALPCPTNTTWTAGAWDNGVPDLNVNAIIADNFNTSNGGDESSFSTCSLLVNTGAILTVADNSYLVVEHNVVVDGTLRVETQGNFVQNDDLGTFTNNGVSSVNKETATKQDWYYYTYWSSPVVGETIADAFPNTDGDRRFWFNAANYLDAGGDDIDDDNNDWTIAAGTDVMQPGVGYAATSGRFGFYPGTDNAAFNGSFNTGDISTIISYNAANIAGSWNFIGNPYPSAINFDAFHAANNTVIEGATYFWSQATPPDDANPGNQQNNFSINDYAIYTVASGGIDGGGSGIIPDQYVSSGQGFFIRGLTNSTVTFTNAMRMPDGTSNTQFYKNSSSKNKTTSFANRLWVNLTSDNGVFNQILVAYVDGATNSDDGSSYDAKRLLAVDFPATLYSTIENSVKKFAIQGKNTSSLTEDEIVKLGFATNIEIATNYKLSIAQLQGEFLTSNPIYLKDNLLNTLHDLSTSDYTFTSEVGEFNDRFEIGFSAIALSTEDFDMNSNTLKILELEADQVQFTASMAIISVRIFDLLGRQLYDFKGLSNSETYKLSNLSSTIYIAKVELSNGAILTKKAFKK